MSLNYNHTLLIASLFFLLISSCSFNQKQKEKSEHPLTTTESLYQSAITKIQKKYYLEAIVDLNELLKQTPVGRLSELAKLQLIYAMFQLSQYENVQILSDSIIELNPNHYNIEYIHYVKGLSFLFQVFNELPSVKYTQPFKVDLTDIKVARDLFIAYLRDYPNSIYSKDVYQRILYCEELLAQSEISIAHFYIQKKTWLSAHNRAKYALTNFPHSTIKEEALIIIYYTAQQMNLAKQSQDALTTLNLNFNKDYSNIKINYFKKKESLLKKQNFLDKWIIKATSPIQQPNH